MCVCTNQTMTNLGASSKVENSIPCFPNGVASCTKGKLLGTHQCNVYKLSRKRRSVDRNPIIPTVYIDELRIQKVCQFMIESIWGDNGTVALASCFQLNLQTVMMLVKYGASGWKIHIN